MQRGGSGPFRGVVKVSSVLVVAKAPLRFLPREVLHALEAVLFQWFEGADQEHGARWRRMWKRLYRTSEFRPSLQLWVDVDRSRPYHARWMSVETRLFDSQDHFYNKPGLRLWLKTGAAFGNYESSAGQLVFVPSSLNWEDCSDDEMREFTADAVDFLHTPHALATLWPAVAEERREEMLHACLNPPDGDHDDRPA